MEKYNELEKLIKLINKKEKIAIKQLTNKINRGEKINIYYLS